MMLLNNWYVQEQIIYVNIVILQNALVQPDLHIYHLLPRSIGGSDDISNLALACRRCNERRYNFIAGFDSKTQKIVPLFNPRQQMWSEHFIWSANGKRIIGVTPTDRATCKRLDINDERYPEDDSIQSARGFWVQAGLHPPEQDPVQSA